MTRVLTPAQYEQHQRRRLGTQIGESAAKQMVRELPIAPERDELKACLDYLNAHPRVAFAVRMNTGAMQIEERFVKFGFTGCSDIIGMLKGGQFLAFEAKRKGAKLTDDQFEFLGLVHRSGGLSGWGTIDQCIAMMKRYGGVDVLPTKERIMRQIDDHKVNPANDLLTISVLDEPGAGGANHEYEIGFPVQIAGAPDMSPVRISFQNGPIAEAGVNGVTQEALMAICIDRLRSFQAGPYACRENAIALTKLEEAMHWLLSRTRKRMARGVEGTSTV